MKSRTAKRAFWPERHGRYVGIYRCVYCNHTSKHWLPVTQKQIRFAVQFLQNPFLGFSQKSCPQCGRHQWLEKIVDPHTGDVLLAQTVLNHELHRLESLRNRS